MAKEKFKKIGNDLEALKFIQNKETSQELDATLKKMGWTKTEEKNKKGEFIWKQNGSDKDFEEKIKNPENVTSFADLKDTPEDPDFDPEDKKEKYQDAPQSLKEIAKERNEERLRNKIKENLKNTIAQSEIVANKITVDKKIAEEEKQLITMENKKHTLTLTQEKTTEKKETLISLTLVDGEKRELGKGDIFTEKGKEYKITKTRITKKDNTLLVYAQNTVDEKEEPISFTTKDFVKKFNRSEITLPVNNERKDKLETIHASEQKEREKLAKNKREEEAKLKTVVTVVDEGIPIELKVKEEFHLFIKKTKKTEPHWAKYQITENLGNLFKVEDLSGKDEAILFDPKIFINLHDSRDIKLIESEKITAQRIKFRNEQKTKQNQELEEQTAKEKANILKKFEAMGRNWMGVDKNTLPEILVNEELETLKKLSKLVEEVDNLSYVEELDKDSKKIFDEKYFLNKYPTSLRAMAEKIPFDVLIKWFREGTITNSNHIFSDTELKGEIGNTALRAGTLAEKCKEYKGDSKKTLFGIKNAEEYAKKEGREIQNTKLGKIIIHDYHQGFYGSSKTKEVANVIPEKMGYVAAKALGYDTFISFNPKYNLFKINSDHPNMKEIGEALQKEFPGTNIWKDKIIFGPEEASERANITLERLLNTIDKAILENTKTNTNTKIETPEEKEMREMAEMIAEMPILEAEKFRIGIEKIIVWLEKDGDATEKRKLIPEELVAFIVKFEDIKEDLIDAISGTLTAEIVNHKIQAYKESYTTLNSTKYTSGLEMLNRELALLEKHAVEENTTPQEPEEPKKEKILKLNEVDAVLEKEKDDKLQIIDDEIRHLNKKISEETDKWFFTNKKLVEDYRNKIEEKEKEKTLVNLNFIIENAKKELEKINTEIIKLETEDAQEVLVIEEGLSERQIRKNQKNIDKLISSAEKIELAQAVKEKEYNEKARLAILEEANSSQWGKKVKKGFENITRGFKRKLLLAIGAGTVAISATGLHKGEDGGLTYDFKNIIGVEKTQEFFTDPEGKPQKVAFYLEEAPWSDPSELPGYFKRLSDTKKRSDGEGLEQAPTVDEKEDLAKIQAVKDSLRKVELAKEAAIKAARDSVEAANIRELQRINTELDKTIETLGGQKNKFHKTNIKNLSMGERYNNDIDGLHGRSIIDMSNGMKVIYQPRNEKKNDRKDVSGVAIVSDYLYDLDFSSDEYTHEHAQNSLRKLEESVKNKDFSTCSKFVQVRELVAGTADTYKVSIKPVSKLTEKDFKENKVYRQSWARLSDLDISTDGQQIKLTNYSNKFHAALFQRQGLPFHGGQGSEHNLRLPGGEQNFGKYQNISSLDQFGAYLGGTVTVISDDGKIVKKVTGSLRDVVTIALEIKKLTGGKEVHFLQSDSGSMNIKAIADENGVISAAQLKIARNQEAQAGAVEEYLINQD